MEKLKLLVYKLSHWEYYPFYIVYLPLFFVWLYHSIKAGSLFYFNALNPGIENGKFLMDSKKEIYIKMPEGTYPKSLKFKPNGNLKEVNNEILINKFSYPFIAKPDFGLRGLAVQKLENEEDLVNYMEKIKVDYLLQDFINYPNEMGIFYVRMPGENSGKITGIVSKEFMCITGDGISTIEQLLMKTPRYHLQLAKLKNLMDQTLDRVPVQGETINLVPYGNHSRGTKFLDASHLITEKLTSTINKICLQIDGFYYGRLDIKYQSFEQLEQGQNYSILELNGAISEPTHIYDPIHSIFFAWKEGLRHFTLLYKICVINHQMGVPYYTFSEGRHLLKAYGKHLTQIK